jgi:uncharacterized protein
VAHSREAWSADGRSRAALTAFFVLACAISWTAWAPLWAPRLGIPGLPVWRYQHELGAWGPASAAFVVSAFEQGRHGPLGLLRRAGAWRGEGRLAWAALALGAPYGILATAVLAAALFEGHAPDWAGFGRSTAFAEFPALAVLAFNVMSFGLGEEVGWRGFALARLQRHHTAWRATLYLTAGWALWHLPLFLYRPGYLQMGLAGAAGWLFSLLTGAVLLTWLYNESRGSIFVVALFHASVDVAFTSPVGGPAVAVVVGVLVTLWGMAVLLLAGPRCLSRTGSFVEPLR